MVRRRLLAPRQGVVLLRRELVLGLGAGLQMLPGVLVRRGWLVLLGVFRFVPKLGRGSAVPDW